MRHDKCKRRCNGFTRRDFLLGAGAGLAVGGPLGWWGLKARDHWQATQALERPIAQTPTEFGMPGRYPGRVIEVLHEGSVDHLNRIQQQPVRAMLGRGMCELTGADHAAEAWRSFFSRDDVIGIKVNPVGMTRNGSVPSVSTKEVILEIVDALKNQVGVPARNLILFERYANEFRMAGYETLMRERSMDGIRWFASAHAYDETQVAIDGQDPNGLRDPHVVGYDPDVHVTMGFAAPAHDPRDERRHLTHLSLIVTKMVNKIITIPVLKDHRSAGVTLALKNLSHGMNNNVARSHIAGLYRRDGAPFGPNQCNTFIPTAVNQKPLREKATLHIMDGLIAVYEGGPGSWNRTWGTWRHKGLFFATDPVAMDHVGWQIIDAKRAQLGWAPVARMGMFDPGPFVRFSPGAAAMAAGSASPLATAAMFADYQRNLRLASTGEPFERRQPEHIILAGMAGLGVWDPALINHKRVVLPQV